MKFNKVKMAFLTMGVVVVIGILFLALNPTKPNFCGGNTIKVYEDGQGFVDKTPGRSAFFDPETDIMWLGGQGDEGLLRTYKPSTGEYEICMNQQNPVRGHVNKFIKWGTKVVAIFDNKGIGTWDGKNWTMYLQPSDEDNDGYGAAVDPRNNQLVIATRSSLLAFDGAKFAKFDIVPPINNFSSILSLSSTDWFFGLNNDGMVRYNNGTWERYNQHGIQVWNGTNWVDSGKTTFSFPLNVRSLDKMASGNILIAADNDKQSGLVLLRPWQDMEKDTVYATSIGDESNSLWHLTNAKNWNSEGFAATNWNAKEGAGTYFSPNMSDKPSQLTDVPSFDLVLFSNSAFIATSQGTLKVKLPFTPAMTKP